MELLRVEQLNEVIFGHFLSERRFVEMLQNEQTVGTRNVFHVGKEAPILQIPYKLREGR